MKRLAAMIMLGILSVGWRKAQKKQAKAQKKYAKAQRKAERKMLKTERKNTKYPLTRF